MYDIQQTPGYAMMAPTDVEGLERLQPWHIAVGGLGLLVLYGGALAGLTAAHRKKGRNWYCSVMPSMFWSSLITGAVATTAVVALGAAEGM